MAREEREKILEQLRQNVTDGDFWDMIEADQIDRILTALDEEWG